MKALFISKADRKFNLGRFKLPGKSIALLLPLIKVTYGWAVKRLIKFSLLSTFFILQIELSYGSCHEWEWQRPWPQGNNLHYVHMINADNAVAIGQGNTIINTDNGGNSWQINDSCSSILLTGIDFFDDQYGWIVGQNGIIQHTIDGGESWKYQNSGTNENLRNIFFATKDSGWAVGGAPSQGFVLQTSNGGKTWNQQNIELSSVYTLADVYFLDSQNGWAVGNHGTIIQTNDGGNNWSYVPNDLSTSLYQIQLFDESTALVRGVGNFYKTSDGGNNWLNIETPGSAGTINFHFANEQTGWITNADSEIYRTNDGGNTWEKQLDESRNTILLLNIHFSDSNHGMAVGRIGRIVTTNDGGQNWHEISERNHYSKLNDVSFPDSKNGWVCGLDTIYRTSNGGKTWENMEINLSSPVNLWGVHFVTPDSGWTVGQRLSESLILHTSDGGNNWSEQKSWNHLIQAVFFINSRKGWAVGRSGMVFHTQDGGVNWTVQSTPTVGNFQSVFFTDANNGWIANYGGSVLHTNDGGENWQEQVSGWFRDIFFVDSLHGWVVGNSGNIFYTENGGTNWYPQMVPTSNRLYGVYFTDYYHGWAVGANATTLYTSDGGKTWHKKTNRNSEFFASLDIYAIDYGSKDSVWIVGERGMIMVHFGNYPLIADAGKDSYICGNWNEVDTLGGKPAGKGGMDTLQYIWVPEAGLNDPNIPNPVASPDSTTTYTLTVTDGQGIKAIDSVTVNVFRLQTTIRDYACGDEIFDISSFLESYKDTAFFTVNGMEVGEDFQLQVIKDTFLTIKAFDSNNCYDSTSLHITHHPMPHPQIDDHYFCQNEKRLITATKDTGNISINWYDPAGNPVHQGTEFIPSLQGKYIIEYAHENGICNLKDSFKVYLQNEEPLSLNDTTICGGETLKYSSGYYADSYAWRNVETNELLSNNSELVITPEQTVSITLEIKDLANSKACVKRDTFSIFLHDLRGGEIKGPDKLCQGDTATFFISSPAESLHWNVSGGEIIHSEDSSISVSWNGDTKGNISVVQKLDHCTDEAVKELSLVTVPEPEIISEGSVICRNDEMLFEGITAEDSSFYWMIPDGSGVFITDSTKSEVRIKWKKEGESSVQLHETWQINKETRCKGFSEAHVTVEYSPVSNNISGPDTVCLKDEATYSVLNFEPDVDYSWQVNGGTLVEDSNIKIKVKWEGEEGELELISIDTTTENNCRSTSIMELPVMNPNAAFNYSRHGWSFIFVPEETDEKSEYIWNPGNEDTIQGEERLQYVFDEPGSYDVSLTVIDEMGCQSKVTRTVYYLQNPGGSVPCSHIVVFPNPFHLEAELMFLIDDEKTVNARLYDAYGRHIRDFIQSEKLQKGNYSLKIEPDRYGLEAGTYFLILELDEMVCQYSIIYSP